MENTYNNTENNSDVHTIVKSKKIIEHYVKLCANSAQNKTKLRNVQNEQRDSRSLGDVKRGAVGQVENRTSYPNKKAEITVLLFGLSL